MNCFYQLLLIPVLLALSFNFLSAQCPEPGTMNTDPIVICDGETVTFTHNGDEVLSAGDVFMFVLHDLPGTTLGSVIDTSSTAEFTFNSEFLSPNTTYYISAVASPDNNMDGYLDWSDPCLVASEGTPVMFSAPVLQCGGSNTFCFENGVWLDCFVSSAIWPITFEWTDATSTVVSVDSQLLVTEPGMYTLVVTDANGCSSDPAVFNMLDAPEWTLNISGENVLVCDGLSATILAEVTGPGNNFTYLWSNGATGPAITVLTSGTYCVTVFDSFGCSEEACLEIVQADPLDVQISITDSSCESLADGTATIFVTGGTAPYIYEWSTGENTPTVVSLPPGGYSVTVTDANGCTAIASVEIGILADAPNADAGPNLTIDCNNPTVTLDGSNSTAAGEIAYQWTGPDGFISNEVSVDVSIPGFYTLRVTDVSNETCFSEDVIWVLDGSVEPELDFFVVSCDSIFVFYTVNGDSVQLDVEWTLPDGGTLNGGNYLLAEAAGLYQVNVEDTESGCTGSGSIWIDVSPGDCSELNGKVFWDEIDNCAYDGTEVGLINWIVTITDGTTTYYRATDVLGDFDIALYPGTYTVTVSPQGPLWIPCETSYTVEFTGPGEVASLEIPIGKVVDCPYLTVDISTPLLRRCFTNNYYVDYCNYGTGVAEDATVEISLDPFMSYHSSEIPLASQDGNILTFDLGDIEIGECGDFWVNLILNCDATLGQTHCVEAEIFPHDPCIPPSPGWSGASLEVEAECVDDQVIFRIINVGDDMLEPVNYIVIEDGVMMITANQVLLASGADETISYPANGDTYRLEVEQVAEHPGFSMPTITVEACGVDGTGNFSTGLVNILPMDDNDPFLDVDCRENIGSWDPNDKMAFPRGVGEEHYILANTDLEYHIRFQNTGTDTAFNVVIRDTLSPLLDITSVRPSVSSHPYAWDIDSSNVLVFTFENIMLPDSNVNEAASHGFIRFRIAQQPDLPLGSVIENSAAIFFDFNAPVITNTVFHEIGEEFIEVVNITDVIDDNLYMTVAPNPMGEVAYLQFENPDNESLQFLLYDATGRLVRQEQINADQHPIKKGILTSGFYFFHVQRNGQIVGRGKIQVR